MLCAICRFAKSTDLAALSMVLSFVQASVDTLLCKKTYICLRTMVSTGVSVLKMQSVTFWKCPKQATHGFSTIN